MQTATHQDLATVPAAASPGAAAPPAPPAWRVPLYCLLLASALVLLVQLLLLGAWRSGPRLESLDLRPVTGSRVVQFNGAPAVRFDAAQQSAVAVASDFNLRASDVLAVRLHLADGYGAARIAFAWRNLEERRTSANTSIAIADTSQQRTAVIPLAGHARWQGTVIQAALSSEPVRQELDTDPNVLLLSRLELIPATPWGALRLLAATWFERSGAVVVEGSGATRVLPLSIWLASIAAATLLLIAFWHRREPTARAAALRIAAVMLGVVALAMTLLAGGWPGITRTIFGGTLAALALVVVGAPWQAQAEAAPRRRWLLSIGLVAGAALLAPTAAAVAVLPLLLLAGAARLPGWVPTSAGLIALLPALALGAVAQRLIPAPTVLQPLADPTQGVLSVASAAVGLPALVVLMLLGHRLWPAAPATPRIDRMAAAALTWALLGAICVFAVPRLAAIRPDAGALVAVLLPALACLPLVLAPRLNTVATATALAESEALTGATEADLSADALALLQGHAERVRQHLADRKAASARTAVKQMVAMAPAARQTAFAQLQVALAEGRLTEAHGYAARLARHAPPSADEADALLDYAARAGEYADVIALAARASGTADNLRRLATAHLLTEGPEAAINCFAQSPIGGSMPLDVAELFLLRDDNGNTQRALAASDIPLESELGQAYYMRLGLRALGPAAFEAKIQKLVTWAPKVGAAQAAMGELLMRQGNAAGARSRIELALQLDPALWPLRWHLLSAQQQSGSSAAAVAGAGSPAAAPGGLATASHAQGPA